MKSVWLLSLLVMIIMVQDSFGLKCCEGNRSFCNLEDCEPRVRNLSITEPGLHDKKHDLKPFCMQTTNMYSCQIFRGCSTKVDGADHMENHTEGCTKGRDFRGKMVEICYCETDECNNKTSNPDCIAPSTALTLASSLLLFLGLYVITPFFNDSQQICN